MTSILFLVQFNNFALTMGFYWSHTLLLMSPVLMHTCLYQGIEPSYYLSRQCVLTMHVVLALIRNIHNLAFEKEEGGGEGENVASSLWKGCGHVTRACLRCLYVCALSMC